MIYKKLDRSLPLYPFSLKWSHIDFANSDSVNYLPTKCKHKQPFPIKNIKNVVSTQAGCQTAFTKEWERYTLMINIMLIYRD